MVFADGTSFKGRWEDGAWVQSAADPARCRLRGGGLARAAAGRPAGFVIQARDEDNNPRLSGGDAFTVTLLAERAEAEEAPPQLAQLPAPAEGRAEPAPPALAVAGAGAVVDCGDGTYEVTYRLERAGRYLLAVTDGARSPAAAGRRGL
jgi:hypothetical protein